jgi:hypothetical protein
MQKNHAFVASLCLISGLGVIFATPLEQNFISNPGWMPGVAADTIRLQHATWHNLTFGTKPGKEFLEFHREFLAQSDDFRIYGAFTGDPAPAVVPVLALVGSPIKFGHIGVFACPRGDGETVESAIGCHRATVWDKRTENPYPIVLAVGLLGFPDMYDYSADDLGVKIRYFHDQGHSAIGGHLPYDMQDMRYTTADGAFYQWHKNLDNIYADWAVGKYQLLNKSGKPIFFSVRFDAVGAAGSVLNERRQGPVYQGNLVPGANQFGAIPRIGSDIYVGNNDNSNLLYAAGTRRWNSSSDAWDVDAWSILNPAGNSGWYFSVATTGSAGDVFESSGTGTKTVYRTAAALGLAANDNLDALEVDQQRRVQGTNDYIPRRQGIYDRPGQWFSLRSTTTYGVKALGGVVVSHNDILRFDEDGNLRIDVAGTDLGLGALDDLDALAIVDQDGSLTLNVGDRIYFSLTAASPFLDSLGVDDSGATVLCKLMGPPFSNCPGGLVSAGAIALGLAAGDELDALDVRKSGAGALAPAQTLTGACCHASGSGPDCTEVEAINCPSGDTFIGEETVCDTAQCPSDLGACCSSNGTCTFVTDRACLIEPLGPGTNSGPGIFKGAGVSCAGTVCPAAPANDECATASVIPYTFVNGYEPPADNTSATVPTYAEAPDPPYSCHDHNVFAGAYGSGTIWYSYQVPPGSGPKRSIYVDPRRNAQFFPDGGGAGDTRLALYFSASGTCSTLQEVACADNFVGIDPSENPYAPLRYDNPVPGRYYLQVSTAYNAQRGHVYLTVSEPSSIIARIPTMSSWGLAVLAMLLAGAAAFWLRLRRTVA